MTIIAGLTVLAVSIIIGSALLRFIDRSENEEEDYL